MYYYILLFHIPSIFANLGFKDLYMEELKKLSSITLL